jgi:O-antigen ligase/Flp pilus assembly protein TadD
VTVKRNREIVAAAIEGIWLAAVLLIPLAFGPPDWFAQFDAPKVAITRLLAATLGVLWLVDGAHAVATAGRPSQQWWKRLVPGVGLWLSANPLRYVAIGAVALLVVVALSAAASPLARGAWRGFEVGQDGYSVLGVASTTLFFFAIGLRLRTEAQVWRLAWVLAGATALASLYAVLQATGLDPYNLLDYSSDRRIIGSFGNPIYLGSALLLGLPMVFALAFRYSDRVAANIVVPVTGSAAGLVIAGLLLSEARGPWLGAAVAGGLFAFAVWRCLPVAKRRMALASLGFATAVALVLVGVLGGQEERVSRLDSALWRATTVSELADSGLSGRLSIWSASLSLVQERPWFDDEDGQKGILSTLFGYGPDSFQYVFPLRRDTPEIETITFTKDGHNQHVHALVELGLFGLLATLSVTLLPVVLGGWWLLRRSGANSWKLQLIASAVVAALAGRLVEQLFGVPRLSDTVLSWALLGLLVALSTGFRPPRVAAPAVKPISVALAGFGVIAGTTLIAGLMVTQVMDPLLASRDAARASSVIAEGNASEAFELTLSAVERAPTVAIYRQSAVSLLTDTRASTVLIADQQRITESTVALLSVGVLLDPYSSRMNALLGVEQLVLAELTNESRDEALATFKRTVDLLPTYWQPKRILGVALVRAERYDEAVLVLTDALETIPRQLSGEPLLYRAQALVAVDRLEEAADDLREARSVTTDEGLLVRIDREIEQLGL